MGTEVQELPAASGRERRKRAAFSFCVEPALRLGSSVAAPLRQIQFLTAVVATAAACALRPSTWTSPVREVLIRQIYFTGIMTLPITCVAGLVVGIAVIAQMGIWLASIDQTDLFGPLVANIVIQILGPMLVNFFVIGRSGTAIATELANMAVHHEIEVIESQGIDPFIYVLVPRCVAVGICVFCLTLIFVASAMVGGYLFGIVAQVPALSGGHFATGVFNSLRPADMVLFVGKTILPGMVTGAICSVCGLSVQPVLTAVPSAVAKAAMTSIWALFLVVGIGSLFVIFIR